MLFPLTRRPVSVVFLVLGFPSLLSIGPCPCCFIYFFLAHRHSFSQSLNQWGEEGRTWIHGVPEDTANEQRAHGFASQMTGPEENTRTRQLNAPKSSFLGYPNEIAPIRTL